MTRWIRSLLSMHLVPNSPKFSCAYETSTSITWALGAPLLNLRQMCGEVSVCLGENMAPSLRQVLIRWSNCCKTVDPSNVEQYIFEIVGLWIPNNFAKLIYLIWPRWSLATALAGWTEIKDVLDSTSDEEDDKSQCDKEGWRHHRSCF